MLLLLASLPAPLSPPKPPHPSGKRQGPDQGAPAHGQDDRNPPALPDPPRGSARRLITVNYPSLTTALRL